MTITNENCVVGIEYEVKQAGTTNIVDSNKGAKPLEFMIGKSVLVHLLVAEFLQIFG